MTGLGQRPVRNRPAARHRGGQPKALYVLVLLSVVALLGYYDRYLMAILVQPIKADLHLSDSQIGLLTGLGFAIVYGVMCIPIARVSDGGRRVLVLTASLATWSVMTALSALSPSFACLLLARIGVGVGEAGGVPTIHAMLAERFKPRWRGAVLSFITVVGGVGILVATTAGGWLAEHWSWRMALLAGAAPGPFAALLLWFTLSDRGGVGASAAAPRESLTAALGVLARRRAFVLLSLGVAVCAIAYYASMNWIPAFLMRRYGLTSGAVGASYGLIMGVGNIVALGCGGPLSDMLSRRDLRWGLWLTALSYLLAFPLIELFLFASSLKLALLLTLPLTLAGLLGSGPAYALVQTLAGSRLRATAAAVYLTTINLLGAGVGPSLAGFLSDAFRPLAGAAALQWSLSLISLAYLAGGLILLAAARTFIADMPADVHDA